MVKRNVIASQRRGNPGGGDVCRDCFVAGTPRNDKKGDTPRNGGKWQLCLIKSLPQNPAVSFLSLPWHTLFILLRCCGYSAIRGHGP